MLYANYAREKLHNLTLVKEASGYPCVLLNSKGKNLKDYRIYGETKYGPNLFKTSSIISNVYPSTTFLAGNQWRGCTFECEPNTTYVVTKKAGETCVVCTSTEYPAVGVTINNRIAEHNNTKVEITTTENDKYITFFFYRNNVDTIPYNTIVESVYISHLPTVEKPALLESVGEKTKNIFNQATTKTSTFSTFDKSYARKFEENVWYRGLTYNNYSNTNELLDYKIEPQSTMIKVSGQKLYGLAQAFKVEPNQTYSFSYESGADGSVGFGFYDVDGNIISSKTGSNVSTITTPENTYWMTVCLSGKTGGVEIIFSNIQLVLGETLPDYEPYGKYKIPVEVNSKNLITINDSTLSPYQASVEFIDNDTVKVIATSASNSAAMKFVPKKEIILKAGKSYYLSADIVEANNPRPSTVALFSATGSYLKWFPGVYTPTEDVSASVAIYPHNTGVAGDYVIVKNIQIEEGTTQTEYEPYSEATLTKIYLNEPLRKIGDYADYIDFKNKKVIRNITEKKLVATSVTAKSTASTESYNYYFVPCAGAMSGRTIPVLATIGGGTLNDFQKKNKEGVFSNINDTYFLAFSNIATLVDAKQFVTDNDVYVDYILATPIEELIEPPDISTCKRTNIIKTDTNILPSDIWVKYISK